jgi:putative flippase GtrA
VPHRRNERMLYYQIRFRERVSEASVQKANAGDGGEAPDGKCSAEHHASSISRRTRLVALRRQFSRFLVVGIATTAVHYGVLIALVEAWNIHPVLGTTAGFVAAVFLSYLLNRRYTFDARPTFGPGLLKYYASVSLGLVINAGLMAQLTAWDAHYLVAQVVASGAALVWNFIAARFLVFRS